MARSQVDARRALLTLRVLVGFLIIVVALMVSRQIGEAARTRHIVEAQAAKLERDVRADCAFKLDVALLALRAPNASPALKALSLDARIAYIGKGCPGTTDPRNGKPFPSPPPLPPP